VYRTLHAERIRRLGGRLGRVLVEPRKQGVAGHVAEFETAAERGVNEAAVVALAEFDLDADEEGALHGRCIGGDR
jgi:hypothetical protein